MVTLPICINGLDKLCHLCSKVFHDNKCLHCGLIELVN